MNTCPNCGAELELVLDGEVGAPGQPLRQAPFLACTGCEYCVEDKPRKFWLSFCDGDRPEGQQFLGVCVVELTAREVAEQKSEIDALFPMHAPGAEWIAAATRKAHLHGCNPGGQVATIELSDDAPATPLNRLMQKDELEQLDLI